MWCLNNVSMTGNYYKVIGRIVVASVSIKVHVQCTVMSSFLHLIVEGGSMLRVISTSVLFIIQVTGSIEVDY